jgi:uncharacterized protein (TIGR03086 family)
MIDLGPATTRLGELIRAVADERLDDDTPCAGMAVGELIDHVQTLAVAFAAAARKDPTGPSGPPPPPDASNLPTDWRERIPRSLDALASAWNDPAAWSGMTKIGGLEMPGDAAGVVALDEVVIHGWDLARSTGRDYVVDGELLEALMGFLTHMSEPAMAPAREGLFGPVVAVPPDAPLLHRVLGLTGRDPAWRPDS